MGAVFVAALTGYVWMGEGGAAALALAGLWGCYATPRPWTLGRAGLLMLLAAVMVVPGSLWAAGMYRPDFAEAIYGALETPLGRLLDFTWADEVAHGLLAEQGDLHCWPAIRLGVAMSWLCALPAAASLALWFDHIPAHWPPAPKRADRVKVLLAMGGLLLLSSALLVLPPAFGLSPVLGAVAYPALCCVWLLSIAGLRAWVRYTLTSNASERASNG